MTKIHMQCYKIRFPASPPTIILPYINRFKLYVRSRNLLTIYVLIFVAHAKSLTKRANPSIFRQHVKNQEFNMKYRQDTVQSITILLNTQGEAQIPLHLILHITSFMREIHLSSLAPDSNDPDIYDLCI